MERYIKVEDAVKVAYYVCGEFRGIFGRIKEQLEALPPADVVERRTGHWNIEKVYEDEYGNEEFNCFCTECGAPAYEFLQPYCHRCGALNGVVERRDDD